MKLLLGAAVTLGAIAALSFASVSQADPVASADPTVAPHFGEWGFDLTGRDTSITPGTDFYGYANGNYVKTLVIPPDRSRYGNFDVLSALSESQVHAILEAAAHDSAATGDEAKIGAFYRAFMDEARADAQGAHPID